MNRNHIYQHNALEPWPLPDESVDMIITSPPYWGLRDYGHDDQIGQESTPEQFVDHMVQVFTEGMRVLKKTGTMWLNLGDSYASAGKNRTEQQAVMKSKLKGGKSTQAKSINQINKITNGIKQKDLVGIPWMVAFALRRAGWYLRQDIIWSKPNPMPESVTDRCTKSHEYIFLLSKSKKYYFDNEAIKMDMATYEVERRLREQRQGMTGKLKIGSDDKTGQVNQSENGVKRDREALYELIIAGKANKKSVWEVTTKPFAGSHFATFPEDLITDCVLASTSANGNCGSCGSPWERIVEKTRLKRHQLPATDPRYRPNDYEGQYAEINGKADAGYTETKTTGWRPTCKCKGGGLQKPIVLDCFMGAGTTAMVAMSHGRDFIGLELNQKYIALANKRIKKQFGMFYNTTPQT